MKIGNSHDEFLTKDSYFTMTLATFLQAIKGASGRARVSGASLLSASTAWVVLEMYSEATQKWVRTWPCLIPKGAGTFAPADDAGD